MAEKLKVLILNGSPRTEGNTTIAIHEMEHVFEENGVEYETIQVGKMDIRGCAACGTCYKNGKCMFDDIVNDDESRSKCRMCKKRRMFCNI